MPFGESDFSPPKHTAKAAGKLGKVVNNALL
jgi:hypothetical protein